MNSQTKTIHFDEAWERVRQLTGWSDYKELAAFLDSSSQSVSGVKKRGKFPLEWARKIALAYGSFTDYIMDGVGPVKRGEICDTVIGPDLSNFMVAEGTGTFRFTGRRDNELIEIVSILEHDLPEAKKFVLKVLHGRKEIKEGLEGLGMKLTEDH